MTLHLIEPPKKTKRTEPARRPRKLPVEESDRGYVMLAIVICSCIAASVMLGIYMLIRG